MTLKIELLSSCVSVVAMQWWTMPTGQCGTTILTSVSLYQGRAAQARQVCMLGDSGAGRTGVYARV